VQSRSGLQLKGHSRAGSPGTTDRPLLRRVRAVDGLPLGVPGSLPDFLRHEAERLQQQRARAARARRKAPRPTPPAEGGRVPLPDGLSFRLRPRSLRPAQADAAAVTFRRAFLGVWGRVAVPDRRQLLTYWRDQPDRATGADRDGPRHATVRI